MPRCIGPKRTEVLLVRQHTRQHIAGVKRLHPIQADRHNRISHRRLDRIHSHLTDRPIQPLSDGDLPRTDHVDVSHNDLPKGKQDSKGTIFHPQYRAHDALCQLVAGVLETSASLAIGAVMVTNRPGNPNIAPKSGAAYWH